MELYLRKTRCLLCCVLKDLMSILLPGVWALVSPNWAKPWQHRVILPTLYLLATPTSRIQKSVSMGTWYSSAGRNGWASITSMASMTAKRKNSTTIMKAFLIIFTMRLCVQRRPKARWWSSWVRTGILPKRLAAPLTCYTGSGYAKKYWCCGTSIAWCPCIASTGDVLASLRHFVPSASIWSTGCGHMASILSSFPMVFLRDILPLWMLKTSNDCERLDSRVIRVVFSSSKLAALIPINAGLWP